MMSGVLLWLYVVNVVLLIDHEIDSAYWREWELFKLPGGISGFLFLHIPLVFVILWGLILIVRGSWWGFVFSFLLSCGGLFAFFAHAYFLKKGKPQFDTWASKAILAAILVTSLSQIAVTLYEVKA
jgi:hypothetical protein